MRIFSKKKQEPNKHHYGDVIRWIEKIINSCQNLEQLKNTEKMIRLFEREYEKDLPSSERLMISHNLFFLASEKWGDLTLQMILKAEHNDNQDESK